MSLNDLCSYFLGKNKKITTYSLIFVVKFF